MSKQEQMYKMMQQMQMTNNDYEDIKDNKERLRAKLNGMRNGRLTKNSKEVHEQKKADDKKEKVKENEVQRNEDFRKEMLEKLENGRKGGKSNNKKLAKISKSRPQVSLDDVNKALEALNYTELSQEDMNRHRNTISLYSFQMSKNKNDNNEVVSPCSSMSDIEIES